jgi:hypothetical protein
MSLDSQRTALIEYLRSKVESEDWHGVSDAANDLRVLEAQIVIRTAMISGVPTMRRCEVRGLLGDRCEALAGHEQEHQFSRAANHNT